MFTHEKFEAYRLAIEFTEIALELIDDLPAGHSSLRDQFRRAAFSVPLNIAEGTGKNSNADRKRFYAIARGSAMECAATCEMMKGDSPCPAYESSINAPEDAQTIGYCDRIVIAYQTRFLGRPVTISAAQPIPITAGIIPQCDPLQSGEAFSCQDERVHHEDHEGLEGRI